MTLQVDVERVFLAHKAVRAELLAERTQRGAWIGHPASSPFATAAAISALVAAHRSDTVDVFRNSSSNDGQAVEQIVQGDLCEFLLESVSWLARNQNEDGGWGDCEGARSDLGTTLLVQAAFRLTGIPAKYSELMDHADEYIDAQGGASALRRRRGQDKTIVAAILANCALAGMISWRQVPALPFAILCLPQRWQQRVRQYVAPPATPLFLAVGNLKFHHDPPQNPISRLLRRSLRAKSLILLERLQSSDDSFLGSTSMTAFVLLCLASTGHRNHQIVQRGVEFLLSTVRADASWSIVPNRALSMTSLALGSLLTDGSLSAESDRILSDRKSSSKQDSHSETTSWPDTATASDTVTDEAAQHHEEHQADAELSFAGAAVDWLLACQRADSNQLTGVPSGGWAWSDTVGALANTVDTARSTISLLRAVQLDDPKRRSEIIRAAELGIDWLLGMQDNDGGWGTFYRTAGNDQIEERGADVTAVALRALQAWRKLRSSDDAHVNAAIERGWKFLADLQLADGSFIPSWFGNEHQDHEQNSVIGTAEALIACIELGREDSEIARTAAQWLLTAQHLGGGWGPPRVAVDYSGVEKDGFRARRANEAMAKFCTVEETALAVSALLPFTETSPTFQKAVSQGVNWLASAVEQDAHRRPAVIGFYPSKIWYHERLYPLVFSTGVLASAASQLTSQRPAEAPVG